MRPTRRSFVIVELAFERNPNVSRFVGHWLHAIGNVDNCEPPCAEGQPRFDMNAFIIGSAVRNRTGHSEQTILGEIATSTRSKAPTIPHILNRSVCYIFVALLWRTAHPAVRSDTSDY